MQYHSLLHYSVLTLLSSLDSSRLILVLYKFDVVFYRRLPDGASSFLQVLGHSSLSSFTKHTPTAAQSSNPRILHSSTPLAPPFLPTGNNNSKVLSVLDEIFWVDNGFGKKEPGALVGCG